jgi:hypothetical protein
MSVLILFYLDLKIYEHTGPSFCVEYFVRTKNKKIVEYFIRLQLAMGLINTTLNHLPLNPNHI